MADQNPKIAVLIPCFNEALTVALVVDGFRAVLPLADIYVYDNNSTDNTAAIAKNAGAIVRTETQKGKGHVIRRMFRDIEADFYIMVDGDDTYDSTIAPQMLATALAGPYDIVNCIRKETESLAYRAGHRFGNALLTGAVRFIFGDRVQDMLSGYKIVSRRFVKSFPILSEGFDIETELTVHALELFMPIAHVTGDYRGRPPGSESKLRTYRDGFRILLQITSLLKHERPFQLFGSLGLAFTAFSLILGLPVVLEFLQTGLVPRLPTAVAALGLMVIAMLSLATGLILDTVTRGRREVRMIAYLATPALPKAESSPPLQARGE